MSKIAEIEKIEDDSQIPFYERWLIIPKMVYFMLNMYVYAFHSIMGFVFKDEWKYEWWLIGYASMITASNFFGAMFWSVLADRTGKYKMIIIVSSILYTITTILLSFPLEHFVNSTFNKIYFFALMFLFNFCLSASFPLVDAQVMGMLASNPRVSKSQFGNQRMFGCIGHFYATIIMFTLKHLAGKATFAGGAFRWSGVYMASFQIITTLVFILLILVGIPDVKPLKGGHHHHHHGEAKKKKKVCAPVPPPASPKSTVSNHESLTAASLTLESTSSFSSANSDEGRISVNPVELKETIQFCPSPMPPSAAVELTTTPEELEATRGRNPIVVLLTNPDFIFLMMFIICAGTVRSVTGTFCKVIAEVASRSLGSQKSGKNLIWTAITELPRVISEILIYLIAPFLKRIMGFYWILFASQIVGILRMIGYAVIHLDRKYSYYLIFVIELLKGFSSGLISSSAIAIVAEISPEGCEATAQGLYSGIYSGLSMAVGGLISGIFLQIQFKDENYYKNNSYKLKTSDSDEHKADFDQAVDIQWLFIFVSILTSIVTILMAAKYIFKDRVMGIPGFPRRSSLT